MVLSPVQEILNKAKASEYAVPCFIMWDAASLRGILAAAEEKNSPIILGIYEGLWKSLPIRYYSVIARKEAECARVPVALHLDHGTSVDIVKKCIQEGFNSVIIDGSALSLQESMSLTRKVVEIAHKLGIGVEGELGHTIAVGSTRVDPEDAGILAQQTGIDSFSVSIGNVSGMPEGETEIDLSLLEEVRKRVSIPLVLHGGTGIPAASAKKAIELGVAKINVGAQLIRAYLKKANQTLCSADAVERGFKSYHDFLRETLAEIKSIAERKIEEFGSSGRV